MSVTKVLLETFVFEKILCVCVCVCLCVVSVCVCVSAARCRCVASIPKKTKQVLFICMKATQD